MIMKLVIDRCWLQDYMDCIKQEISVAEHICNDLRKAKETSVLLVEDNYEIVIGDMEKLKEELHIIYEMLQLFVEGMDEAKRILDRCTQELQETLW